MRETYSFGNHYQAVSGHFSGMRMQRSTLIILDKDAYSEYPGIRVFLSLDQIKGREITYVFKDGLFGPRVVWSYRFQ